jgi:uncharacterized membrane protein YbhN (UPF0104 family)
VSLADLKLKLGRRPVFVAGGLMLVFLVLATTPGLLGTQVSNALDGLARADTTWLWIAAGCFVISTVSSAQAWRAALALVGARLDRADASARFSVGCLVNSFAPAKLGEAARIALFARRLPGDDRLWKVGGVCALVSGGRAVAQSILFAVAFATGAIPLWPLFALAGIVAAAAIAAWVTRGRTAHRGVAHLLDAFRALGRDPLQGRRIVGWCIVAGLARVGAATAIAAALGIPHPVFAALIVVAALDVVGLVPLTPGNVGIASGAVAVALQTRGIDGTAALSAGIALHAVETGVSIALGLAGTISLVRFRSPVWRRRIVTASAATASLVLAAAVGATIFVDLV